MVTTRSRAAARYLQADADGEYIGIFDEAANNFALIDGLEFGEQVTDHKYLLSYRGTGNFR